LPPPPSQTPRLRLCICETGLRIVSAAANVIIDVIIVIIVVNIIIDITGDDDADDADDDDEGCKDG
jgi:hypothetical protein